MENYGILFDGVFGDVDFYFSGNVAELEIETEYKDYIKNMTRKRLKSLDGDYGNAYKYNIIKNIGKNNSKLMEKAIKNSVFNMLTYDGLIGEGNLEVEALSEGHKMVVGIRVKNTGVSEKGFIDIMITREENGKSYE